MTGNAPEPQTRGAVKVSPQRAAEGSLLGSSSGLQTHAIGQELELEYWKDIKDSTEVKDFSDFLSRFPVGIYAERARRR